MVREAGPGACRALAIAALAAVALLAATPAGARAETCAHARALPGTVALGKVRGAVDCLIEKARRRKDVRELRPNSALDDLAQEHAKRMVRFECFTHRCHGEHSLKQRFKESPYVKGASAFRFSEELGYESTPRQMVRRLLASPSHRKNILDPAFRDLGVGARRGTPVSGGRKHKFLTYAIELGALQK